MATGRKVDLKKRLKEAVRRMALRSYSIPDEQEKTLAPGKIIEVELEDPITRELEWVPGLISSIKASGDTILSFEVQIRFEDESGIWTETYKPEHEGQEWRWPKNKASTSEHAGTVKKVRNVLFGL